MFSDTEKQAVRQSWKLVVPIAETAADLFYRRLFELEPQYRQLFPEDLSAQKRKLIRMLAFIVKSINWSDSDWREEVHPDEDLMLVVLALGRRHSELYAIPTDSYARVGEALLWTLDYGLGPQAFTPDVRAAWTRVYTLLAQTMLMGSAAIDREVSLTSAQSALRLGEAALLEQQAEAGIDDAAMGFREEAP